MSAFTRCVVCVGLYCLFVPSHAQAEPVSVTSGFVLVTGPFRLGPISISGSRGFSIEGSVDAAQSRVDPLHLECWDRCLPGSTISVGAAFFGSAVMGTATLDGSQYDLTGGVDDPAAAGLEFVGSLTVPALTASAILLTAPFHMMDSALATPSGTARLRGGGIASLTLSPARPLTGVPDGWVADRIRYDFSEPAPIPEPTTLTLVSMGLAAAALRGRTRRKENACQRLSIESEIK